MSFEIKPKQTLLFIGDSITDSGRCEAHTHLGNRYVKFITDMIRARYPDHRINVINKGTSGQTIEDLANRWTDDVIRHKPHWLSIKIGINDLHKNLKGVARCNSTTDFEQIYDDILTRTQKKTKAKIILINPFYISTNSDPNSWRSTVLKHLPKYIQAVHIMARKHRTRLVKTHHLFQYQLRSHKPDVFCPEPVHPNHSGHMVIAMGWLHAVRW